MKVELTYPLQTPNGEVKTVTLRRPKVKDSKQAERVGTNNIDIELALLASLTEEKLTPEDLEEMDLADYGKLQNAFRSFVGAD